MAAKRRSTKVSTGAEAGQPVHDLIPDKPSIRSVAAAAAECKACDLYKRGSRTVFGEGPPTAEGMQRGEFVPSSLAPRVLATVHPSSILRAPDDGQRRLEMSRFVDDLRKVAGELESAPRRRSSS